MVNIDASTSITLQREILEVVNNKFACMGAPDDLQWPLITSNGSPLRIPAQLPQVSSTPDTNVDSEDDDLVDLRIQKYWKSVQEKYRTQSLAADDLLQSKADGLPPHWTVINIRVTDDKNTMFVTRQQRQRPPLTFCLPLKGRRECDDDKHLTLKDALDEMREIVRLNDEGTKQAIHVKNDKQGRVRWWADRTALDRRLKELLENIEFCWFGAFKVCRSLSYSSFPRCAMIDRDVDDFQ